MPDQELLGYAASSLVLATFWMRRMCALRAVALASNVAFIAYGWLAGIMPVLLLHALLLPLNVFRIVQSWRAEPCPVVHATVTAAPPLRRTRPRRGRLERARRYLMPSRSMR
jgi:hypothetical protein